MGDTCCHNKTEDLKILAEKQVKVLWIVLLINLMMFLVEFGYGLYFESSALTGDSLDMLSDSIAYGSSIFVVGRTDLAKARASTLKAYLMIAMGLMVAGQAFYRLFFDAFPVPIGMGLVGVIALVANIICLFLLSRHRSDDINFSSVWICSRNDIIANISVLIAAGLVALSGTRWPDIIVGFGIAILFLKSAFFILNEVREGGKVFKH